jgi:glycosyltransferase involved in cell wall biosynthesis
MVGAHQGMIPTQGFLMANHFAEADYTVRTASAYRNRYMRWADIAWSLIRDHRSIDIQCLAVFSGPSFIVQDTASFLGKALGQRIIMVLHGGGLPEFIARYPNWARRVLARADALVAPSPFLKRAAEGLGFAVHVIPNLIEVSRYVYRERRVLRPRLFWMRSFHPLYNPAMAIRVLKRVKDQFPDATLVLSGCDKGLTPKLQEMTRECGVADAVRFAGFLDAAGKRREGDAADIYLNTNHVDNMPVAVVEACAMGLPVVATAVGGVPDLITDGETGLLVPDDDDEAMARQVCRLLGDPDLAARLSRNGRRLAERSDWSAVRPQWERLFDDVLSGSHGLGRVSRDPAPAGKP